MNKTIIESGEGERAPWFTRTGAGAYRVHANDEDGRVFRVELTGRELFSLVASLPALELDRLLGEPDVAGKVGWRGGAFLEALKRVLRISSR